MRTPFIVQIINKTASEQLKALRARKVSAVDLLEATIERSEALIPHLNPFALTLYARARQSAQEADRKLAEGTGGKLCGLPVTIKDSQFLAGYPCANGSHILKDFIPSETCRAIELLEQEDAIVFVFFLLPASRHLWEKQDGWRHPRNALPGPWSAP